MSTIAQEPTTVIPRVVTAPLNCSILVTHIVELGDPRRGHNHRLHLRAGLLSVLAGAFSDAGVPWRRCWHQDRGDGLLTVAPPAISTTPLVDPLLPRVAERLGRHNEAADDPVRIRLRCALHPVLSDRTGYPSASIIHAARMLDSTPLRRVLAGSGANLGVMVSDYGLRLRGRRTPPVRPGPSRGLPAGPLPGQGHADH